MLKQLFLILQWSQLISFDIYLHITTFLSNLKNNNIYTAEVLRLETTGEDTNFQMMRRPEQERRTMHKEIVLLANFFKIDSHKEITIHKYDVTFKPGHCPKNVRLELFEKAKSICFQDYHHIFYDGKNSVYSVDAINNYEKKVCFILKTKVI